MDWSALGSDRVFGPADLGRARLNAATVRTAVRRRDIRRLQRGWYTSWVAASAEDDHTLRVIAAVRSRHEACAASHHSALLLHGLPLVDADLSTVWLDHRVDRHHRREGGVRIAPAVSPFVLLTRAQVRTPLLVVPVAVAVVQAGYTSGPRAAIAAADAALRLGRSNAAQLDEAVTLLRRRRDLGPAAAAVALADGRRESPGESLLALSLHQLGIEVEPQVEIPDGEVTWRADFQVKGHRVLVEFDGRVKYESRDDVWREKRREDRLRDQGWEIVRVTWADLSTPSVIADRIRRAITRSLRASA